MVRVCFLFYALLRQIRLIDLRKCDVTFAGIIVNKKLGELKLNPARKRDDIAWFLEAHHQSIDINPKSNGTAPKTTGVTSDTKNLDTSLIFSTSLPTYTPNTKGTPWVRHIKEYEIITNSISSEAQHQYVTKAFAEVHKTVVVAERNMIQERAVAPPSDPSRNLPLFKRVSDRCPVPKPGEGRRRRRVRGGGRRRRWGGCLPAGHDVQLAAIDRRERRRCGADDARGPDGIAREAPRDDDDAFFGGGAVGTIEEGWRQNGNGAKILPRKKSAFYSVTF